MKKSILSISVLFCTLFSLCTVAQDFPDLDKSPMDMASYPSAHGDADKVVRITYSRPSLKDRALEQLAPAGKVWRTGANEAPEITFYRDVVFGGKKIKSGSYTLLTVPGASDWEVILNSKLNEWGAYSYDKDKDVARVQAKSSTAEPSLETFSIMFESKGDGAVMHMGWGTKRVMVPIGF